MVENYEFNDDILDEKWLFDGLDVFVDSPFSLLLSIENDILSSSEIFIDNTVDDGITDQLEIDKKRSYDEFSDSSGENGLIITPSTRILSTRNTSPLSAKSFPTKIYNAFNEGDIDKFTNLVHQYINPDCYVKWHRPGHTYLTQGNSVVNVLHKALLECHPDAIMTVKNSTTKVENNFHNITCNIRFRGTRLFEKAFDSLKNEGFPKPAHLADLFERAKLSDEEYNKYIEMEEVMLKRKEVPMVFMKVTMNMIFDENTSSIKYLEMKGRMSSFKPVSMI